MKVTEARSAYGAHMSVIFMEDYWNSNKAAKSILSLTWHIQIFIENMLEHWVQAESGNSRQRECTHMLCCYFWFLYGASRTWARSEADCECGMDIKVKWGYRRKPYMSKKRSLLWMPHGYKQILQGFLSSCIICFVLYIN